jgi:hypothetical protein
MLVPTIMCCQWIASTLSKTLPYSSSSENRRILSLLINLGLVVTGVCFAIFIRLAGYSYVTGRLLSLFAGLGMSAAITMLVILMTRRGVDEPPDLAQRRSASRA